MAVLVMLPTVAGASVEFKGIDHRFKHEGWVIA